MATQLRLRRGTTTQHSTFTGAEGEVTVDTTKDTLVVHDGTTAGGFPLARESALGTIASQNASNVAITGGSITGITDLAVADGGTGASDAATARTNLGLGSIATQAANSVAITGGTINGTSVGATTASSGAFTTLSATGVTTVSAGTAAAPAITTTGDTNTGIFFPAADTIAFAEGGVEAMRIDSSGNLLIGTTSTPSGSTGALVSNTWTRSPRFATTSTQADTFSYTWSSTTTNVGQYGMSAFAATTAGSTLGVMLSGYEGIAFATNSAERMRIDSSGNVGIGTSSPGQSLDVSKSQNTDTVIRVTNVNTGGSATAQFFASNGTNTTQFFHTGTSYGTSGVLEASQGGVYNTTSAGIALVAAGASGILRFATGGTTERMRIDSSGNVGIGVTPSQKLEVAGVVLSKAFSNAARFDATDTGSGGATLTLNARFAAIGEPALQTQTNHPILFAPNNAERARITSDGVFAVGKTSTDSNTVGASLRTDGYCTMVRSANKCLDVNRQTNDGTLVSFQQDNTEEGSISVSGNTVSYNAFAGSHWSQLQQGRGYNPDILRGTVMSTIGEMCEWKSVVWDEVIEHPAVLAVEAKEAVLDEEGNVVEPAVEAVEGKDAWTETIPHREAYLGNLAVGATFTEDGVTKTVVDDGNERLPKVKISDVVGDKAVYGVFQTWDEVQDMLVTSLGAFVVRIAAGVTVQIGDLLESNGDGCAKVQDDDVIRSKTIGKVTSTTPSATYADGSYTVPAVLYCG